MDLITLPVVAKQLKKAQARFLVAENHVAELVSDALTQVVNWKFATDEYYNPLPLQNELNKFKKGQIRKLDSVGPVYQRGIYSFGFDSAGQLLVTQYIDGEDASSGVNFKLYQYNTEFIAYLNIIHYPAHNFPDYLILCGIFQQISITIESDLGVGRKEAVSVTLFHRNIEGTIEKVERQTVGWQAAVTYHPVYDSKGIKEITTGNVVWWKRPVKG